MKKVSNTKRRIKEIAENSGVSIDKFFENIGMTAANFRGKKLDTGVNSEILDKIVSLYPDTDLHWIITGKKKTEDETDNAVNETVENYDKENSFKVLKAFFTKEHQDIKTELDALKKQNELILEFLHRNILVEKIKEDKMKLDTKIKNTDKG